MPAVLDVVVCLQRRQSALYVHRVQCLCEQQQSSLLTLQKPNQVVEEAEGAQNRSQPRRNMNKRKKGTLLAPKFRRPK